MDPFRQPNQYQDWGDQEEEKVDPNKQQQQQQQPNNSESTKIKISFGMPPQLNDDYPQQEPFDDDDEDDDDDDYDEEDENEEEIEENIDDMQQQQNDTSQNRAAVNAQQFQDLGLENYNDDRDFFQYQQEDQLSQQDIIGQNAQPIPIRIPNLIQSSPPGQVDHSQAQVHQPSNTIQLNFDKISLTVPASQTQNQQQQPVEIRPSPQPEPNSIQISGLQPTAQLFGSNGASSGISIPISIPIESSNIMSIQIPQGPMMSQQQYEPEGKSKKQKKKKKKKKQKGKGVLLDVYDLKKVKLTMELDPHNKRARSQVLYTFKLKSEEQLDEYILSQKKDGISKTYLDLSLHAKMSTILEVNLIAQSTNEKLPLKFDYPMPHEQSQFQEREFSMVSRDLHSLEIGQQINNLNEQKSPLLNVKRVIKINFKHENVKEQLKPKLKMLVTYFIDQITNFGIKQVKYKLPQQYETQTDKVENKDQQIGTYFYTNDCFGSTKLWLPVVDGAQSTPLMWTLRYIVPSEYTVVSSGVLVSRQTEESDAKRTLYLYKITEKEAVIQEKIGFICGQFPKMYKLQESRKKSLNGFLTFFANEKKEDIFRQNNFYEKTIDAITSYLQKLIHSEYPCSSNKLVFVPNLFEKTSRKQSLDFSGGLHIMDEEILFQRNQLENRHRTYKYLASALAYDFFGGKAIEESAEDYWLTLGIRESLGNHFKISKCGVLLYRYHIMQTIEHLYKQMKSGIERYPLQSSNQPHPSEQQLNNIVFEKCELIMHMIESMIDKSYYERIIRQLFASAQPTISAGLFLEIFKEVCGFKLKQFCTNWILSTSCPKLTASYQYNKKNNSLDLQINQKSAMKDYFIFRKFLKQNIDLNTLFTTQFKEFEIKQAMKRLEPIDSFYVELKRECMRWFSGEVNVMIYLTDGAEIQTQQQKMSLKFGKTSISVNIPLQTKVKKTIQNKKKEYESYMYEEIGEEHEEDHQDTSQHQHIVDNSSWKFGLNDFELEDYPYGTKNLFEVKHLEEPILWIRVDPDMEYIRKVEVKQKQSNWLFQLLQEKDIIGQIEAIRQLKKLNTELVYEILKAVSINENYFFKVRKEALKGLQKMQTFKFNQWLSHEKFLIKIFNQRNFDAKLGFYKSNDFTRMLEYYFDKYILKTLAKCKEQDLQLKEDIKEQQLSLIKQFSVAAEGTSIQLNLNEGDIQLPKTNIDDSQFHISSEQTAQMLLKLLQENDNSENPFDDSSYLKQILSSLGNLDNFKYMPEIASEIYRQFRLDHIGKFSPLFSVTKGTISGYYNIRKQIFKFKYEKRRNMDNQQEDMIWYEQQIKDTEHTLNQMKVDIDSIAKDHKWPYQVRMHILHYQVKHTFLYSNFSFLKALYILLKQIDQLQTEKEYRMAIDLMRKTVLFIEDKWLNLDFKEAYMNNERSKAIISILWAFICLPYGFLDQEFIYWIKRLYHQLYSLEVPYFMKDWQHQQGIAVAPMEYDEYWNKEEECADQVMNDDRDRNLNRLLQSRSAQVIIRTPKNEMVDQQYDQGDNKLKIVLGGMGNAQRKQDQFLQQQQQLQLQQQQQQQYYNEPIGGPIKITLGGIQIPQQQQQLDQFNYEYDNQPEQINTFVNERKRTYIVEENMNYDEDESIYDEFAEITFDIEWMQKAWEVLGLLWYHEESAAFLQPVTEEDLGSYFEEYLRVIQYPMDLSTIKQKMIDRKYSNPNQFKMDIQRVFTNCKQFNHQDSDIYQAANKLEVFFWDKVAEKMPLENKSIIKII